ncbi:MAG: hypothetical protein KDB53_07505 [Planctomycetes bacterium]|nr:hypothetical protein [Planctomycetota bacterium]
MADVYAFTMNVESVTATAMNMLQDRRRHAACWLPDNRVLITGGVGSGAASTTAEVFDPIAGTFSMVASMPRARADHTCTLLPDGRVLVAGGRDPGALNTPLIADIYDPKTNTWTSTGTTIDRYQHTASVLVNGICLLIGGRQVSTDQVVATGDVFRTFTDVLSGAPSSGFTATTVSLATARTEHATATLGSTQLLVTGGFDGTTPGSTLGSAEVFIPEPFTNATVGVFSPIMTMGTPRARHTSTTVASGSNILFGGVTGTAGTETALDTIEAFQFNNSVPTVTGVTVSGPASASVPISFTLVDNEGDRSFVFIRFSTDGGTTFNLATLTDPRSTVNLLPGSRVLNWNAAADGVTGGTSVIVEVIPVGGIFGSPVRSVATSL